MNLRKVKVVYLKEIRDVLRDRRTLISMILVPLLVFPILTLGFTSLVLSQAKKAEKQIHKVSLINPENAPHLTKIIQKTASFEFIQISLDSVESAINNKTLRAAIQFPPNLEAKLEEEQNDSILIYYDKTEIKSEIAYTKLFEILKTYSDSLTDLRLFKREFDRKLLTPLKIKAENVASAKKMGGFFIAMFLPYILVILALQGGMYPAIDLTAGEKERGTLETILVSPLSRLELSVGKFLTVLTATVVTAILGTTSMTVSAIIPGTQFGETNATFSLGPEVGLVILILMLPLCCFFAGILLAIALLAKSFKEAQSYLTPLMLLIIFPAMISFLPGFELSTTVAFIPIVSTVMGIKEALLGNILWGKIGITFLSNCLFAAIGVFVAKKAFEKESVLFRI